MYPYGTYPVYLAIAGISPERRAEYLVPSRYGVRRLYSDVSGSSQSNLKGARLSFG
jgi:hypothetical protein